MGVRATAGAIQPSYRMRVERTGQNMNIIYSAARRKGKA
jgi:hypothetical protein